MPLVFLSVILGILAFPLFGIYHLGLIFLVPFFIFLIREKNLFKLLWGTFIFKFFLSLGVAFFIFEPLIFFFSILVFLILPLSIFFLRKFIIQRRFLLAAIPFLWILTEHLQARFSFLPIYIMMPGNIFGSSPFLGLAGVGGLTSLTFFAILVNSLITIVILRFQSSRSEYPRKYAVLGGSIFLIFILIFGVYLISQTKLQRNKIIYQKLPVKTKIALLSSSEKFDKEFNAFKNNILSAEEKTKAEIIINNILKPIKSELVDKQIDLLILPEDMIDIESWKDVDEEARNKFGIENAGILLKVYRRLAQELNINLVATLTTIQNGKRYNSTILFNRQGKLADIYNKFNLTIMGEYWPFGDWRPFYYKFIEKDLLEAGQGRAIFDREYAYQRGQEKTLQTENLIFGSAICSEAQYPWQMKDLKKIGAKFISHTATNRWAMSGLKNFRELTNNLRKIEAVWLQLPILINGREEMAGLITPDGKIDSVNFENGNKNFGIFTGEIKLNQ